MSNVLKILPVEADLFHADGQTDIHSEAKSHLTQFWKRANKKLYILPSGRVYVVCMALA